MNHATHDHDTTARPERAIDTHQAWEDTRDLQAYAANTYGLGPASVGQLIDWCEGASRAAGRRSVPRPRRAARHRIRSGPETGCLALVWKVS